MKLRTRFFLLAILPMTVLLLFTGFAYHKYQRDAEIQMNTFSRTLFDNAVAEANSNLDNMGQSLSFLTFYSNDSSESVLNTLKVFGTGKKYDSFDIWKASQYFRNVFQNLMISNPYLRGIYIFTPDGVTFSNTDYPASKIEPFYDPREDYWYKKTVELEGKYYISNSTSPNMFQNETDSIFMARSISDVYSHDFLGVIVVDCDPAILDMSRVNTMADLTLITISNRKTNEVLYTNVDELDNSFAKSKRVNMSEELQMEPLTLSATFDYSALHNEFDLAGPLLVIIAVLVFLAYVMTSILISRSVVIPLENLSTAMAGQDDKSLAYSSPYMDHPDEIGTLYREYSAMLDKLDESIKKNYKDKLILMDAQMKSLEARIDSHFLFNTLESINSMAELEDNEQISTMALALADMFRYSIKTQSELVQLSDEIKHVEDYVSIQSIRFSGRFTLDMGVPENLRSIRVLKLILQPIVENAFYHGLDYCTKGDRILIRAVRDGQELHIEVSDNGQGMSEEMLTGISEKLNEEPSFTELGHRTKQSIGLKNIHSRIELYYGKGYGLDINSTPGSGTTVTIRIPILEHNAETGENSNV